ncbi:hypothetical protein [Bacteroides propionicifaciens]|uniref:NigD1/NigD2 family lipoprotein n=1 Tax=Bacteroides propionicifaciens TaxID=392838 RepID=UPI00036BDE78|nr:NigD-like C-terminal domain-containing protein [Bacteroides propionicifaciens]
MKSLTKQTHYLIIALVVMGLQSCIRSGDEYSPMAIGTVQVETGDINTLYFDLDSGYKLFPNNPENLVAYDLKTNDRVFIQFTELDENTSKKELTAKIKMLQQVETGNVEFTQDDSSAEGLIQASDRINITEAYIANGFLTLKYSYIGQPSVWDHTIQLYATKDNKIEDTKILKLYLTHDASEDNSTYINNGIISFPITEINDLVKAAEEVSITSKTIYSGVQETAVYIKK